MNELEVIMMNKKVRQLKKIDKIANWIMNENPLVNEYTLITRFQFVSLSKAQEYISELFNVGFLIEVPGGYKIKWN